MQKNSDSMLQPQMYGDQFRNISDLDLAEPNRIGDSIYAGIRLLFADFLMLKMSHTCTCHSATQDTHRPYFLFCG